MAFVVPGVARFAVNQTLEGRSVVNVLDYDIDTTGSTMSRADAVQGQAESIINQWVAQFLPVLVSSLTLDSVSFVDLDSATGVTGSVLSDGTTTLPAAGSIVTSSLPGNTSVLITKQVTSARGRRNGRMFLAGGYEGMTQAANGNVLEVADRAGFQTRADAFLANTNELDGVGTAFSSNMVVVSVLTREAPPAGSTGPGAPLTGEGSVVQSLVVDSLLATQRRRLRG